MLKRSLVIWQICLLVGCSAVSTLPLQKLQTAAAGTVVRFLYDSQGGEVEAYLVRPQGKGPFPLLILLHGHSWVGVGASRMVPIAERFSTELCYAGLAISLPGYGSTAVAQDNDRNVIVRLLLDGIAKATELPWIDQKRLILYGFSRGAVFGAATVSQVPNLRAVVLHSGAYDIPRLYRETASQWVRRSLNPDGEANPKLFNLLPEVSAWKAPTLILHGALDEVVPVSQARSLKQRLEALGIPQRLVIFPEAGHRLPADPVREEVLSFLTRHVESACRTTVP